MTISKKRIFQKKNNIKHKFILPIKINCEQFKSTQIDNKKSIERFSIKDLCFRQLICKLSSLTYSDTYKYSSIYNNKMKQAQNNFLSVPTYTSNQPAMYKSGIFPKRQFYTPKSNLSSLNNQSTHSHLNPNSQQKKNEPLTPNLQKKSYINNNFLNTLKNPQQKFNYGTTSKSMIFEPTNNQYSTNNTQPKKSFGLLENMARTIKQPYDEELNNIPKNNSFTQNKINNFLEVPQNGIKLGKMPFNKDNQFKSNLNTHSPNEQNQKNSFLKKQFRSYNNQNQKQEDQTFKKPILTKFKNFTSISPNNSNNQSQKLDNKSTTIENQKNNFASNNLNVPTFTRQRSNTSNAVNLHRVHTQQSLNQPHHSTTHNYNHGFGSTNFNQSNQKFQDDQTNRRASEIISNNNANNDSPNRINGFKKIQRPNNNLLVPEPFSAGKIKTFSANKQQSKVGGQSNGSTVPNFLKFKTTPKKDQQAKMFEQNSFKSNFWKSTQESQNQQSSSSLTERNIIRPMQFGTKMNTVQKIKKDWSMNDFQIKQRLGKGAFGDVYIARQNQTGFVCVLKKLSKKKIKQNNLQEHVMRQIKIQSYLDHKNLTALYGFFDDADFIYLIMEFLTDGSLSQTKKKKKLPENQVSNIVKQVCQGLKFMHNEEIIHRDLKPQNIFVHEDYMKIGDFGCAVFTNTKRTTVVGCLAYISPQQLNNDSYDDKIDVWSVGILTYQLLAGKAPFQADIIKIARQQKQAKLSLIFDQAIQFSQQARSFIGKLLEQIPQNRMTIKQALNHPFITKYKPIMDQSILLQTKALRTP